MGLTIRGGWADALLGQIEGDILLQYRGGVGSLASPASRKLSAMLPVSEGPAFVFQMMTDEVVLSGCRVTSEGGDPFRIHFTYEREEPRS